jgi:pimeloyl-ACP methyl ester carboxylesterase
MVSGLLVAAFAAAIVPGLASAREAGEMPPVPPAECEAMVHYDREMVLPGYILPTSAGPRTCIPFTSSLHRPPAGYEGDYYVDEFTDEKLRDRWEQCKQDKECRKRVFDQVHKRRPPNGEFNKHDPRDRFLIGKIQESGGATDLSQIRRPGFFAREPYEEAFASVDADTSIVEFTVPVEAYERLQRGMDGTWRIRGWYIRGKGIVGPDGIRKRALVISSGGGGDRIAAIDDPRDRHYEVKKDGTTVPNDDWPSERTGFQGMRHWREVWRKLHEAGYDVLALDRRGVGISGGYSDTNTLQQGRDLLTVVESLRSGKGMRALSSTSVLTTGAEAAQSLRGGPTGDGLPVLFLGSSRGTMSGGWAMAMNFDRSCTYDQPEIICEEPRRDLSIKGAMFLAEYTSGTGYVPAETTPKDDGRGPGRDRDLFIGGIEQEHNIVFFPSSAILSSMSRWPSVFLARGLWCYADSLEGSMDSYRRVDGPKELVVVRGPHPFTVWPQEEKDRVVDRMIAYGKAAVFGYRDIPGARRWSNMKDLVATASDVWEPSTRPTLAK